MPSHRRSSRLQLTERRCSLQSLSVDLDDDQQPRRSARTPPKKQPQQQPRRSKRIQQLNAKKTQSSSLIISQSHQPSSPVSVTSINDNNLTSSSSEDDLVPKMASLSIITPIKPTPPSRGVVRFGNNSVARFSGCDPPIYMERLSPNASRLILPHDNNNNEDNEDDELELDDETKWNCHILAQWDDSFEEEEELDHDDFEESSLLDEEESVEMPCHDDDVDDAPLWQDGTTTASRVIVEEEEDFIFNNDNGGSSSLTSCRNVSNRPNKDPAAALSSSRPIKRVDEYYCKSCGRGMRRTSRYVYEED